MNVKKLKNYIDGQWLDSSASSFLSVENPSTGEAIAMAPLSPEAEVERAICSAEAAFPSWSRTPVSRRVSYLFKLLNLVRENEEKITRCIAEEMGKSVADAGAEVKRMVENIEVACGMPVLQQGDKLMESAGGIDGEVIKVPVGVFGLIAPYNFPAMVPFWFIPYAIAAGNTYVAKPSELVPCTMQLLTEMIHESGLPKGVFNLVNGGKEAAEVILESPVIKGVSFVGSTAVGKIVAEKCARTGKRYQAMGSAKNHLVVMPDAKIDEVVRNMITSCFGCAGQRCMASSAIVCVGDDTYEKICSAFVKEAGKVITADPLDPEYINEPVMMGPVISAKAKERILGLIRDGIDEGATLALDGRDITVPGCENGYFIGPTVFTDVKPGMKIHTTEIFGPVVVILKANDLDEAIGIINSHQYGNGGSIYTQNGFYARKFKLEAQVGMVGINVGIPAPVAYLPFGGTKASLYADIKAQGKAVVDFFTESRIITERYWTEK